MNGTLIPVSGPTREVWLPGLMSKQQSVGGLIEFVYSRDGSALMVNEEGKLHGLELNVRVTALLRKWYPDCRDVIVGDAVLFSAKEMERDL